MCDPILAAGIAATVYGGKKAIDATTPDVPDAVKTPEEPEEDKRAQTEALKRYRDMENLRRRLVAGGKTTVMTSPLGVTTPYQTKKKTLLGA